MTMIHWPFARAAVAVALTCLAAACGDGRARPSGDPVSALTTGSAPSAARLPRLVDVGAARCVPCKAMAPILEGLRSDLAGRLDVVFVDVWSNPDAAAPYAIRMMPTQIFYAADGRELSRHEGFMSREEILARWRSHGLAF